WQGTINWKDGSPIQDLVVNSDHTFSSPTHVYGDEGTFVPVITIRDATDYGGGAVATGATSISVGASVPTFPTVVATSTVGNKTVITPVAPGQQVPVDERHDFSLVATFTDPGFGPEEAFTYSINWGDNTSESGNVTNVTQNASGSSGTITSQIH